MRQIIAEGVLARLVLQQLPLQRAVQKGMRQITEESVLAPLAPPQQVVHQDMLITEEDVPQNRPLPQQSQLHSCARQVT